MKIKKIFITMLACVALINALDGTKVPFKGVENWLKSQSEAKLIKRSSNIKEKALIVHAIERRDLKEGLSSDGLGRADFKEAENISQNLSVENGELVESIIEPDQVHYYYYKTKDASSVKATLAWSERNNSNLNLRVIGSHGAVRPWSQSNSGKITRNQKETGATVERVDTEISKSEEIVIKVSAPEGVSQDEKYVLIVSGCEFSERQKNSNRFLDNLVEEDAAKEKRVEDYIKNTGAKRDSIGANGKKWRMVDVIDGSPKYLTTFNLNAAKSAAVDKVWPGGGLGLSLTGSGLERSLGIWDEGAVRTTHQEVTGRVTLGDNVSPAEHSSHVGGTMIGSGAQPSAKGMAYEAKLKSYDWNSDVSEMGSEARNGLIISQHSYGMPGDYSYSRSWDQLANQYPMYTISKSAANEGKFRGVTRDGNAKNVITVGSAQDQPNGWQGPSSNSAVLSSFSSKGPAPDGRIKPDILANGQDVYSMIHNGDTQYKSMSGTSMAGPSHAAAISLLQEHYYNINNETYMDAATLKALVIHSADEVDAEGPDFSSGWGYLNVKTGTEIITNDDGLGELIQVNTIDQNSEVRIPAVHENGEDIIATIVWNDPAPSSNSGDALVNDLDLRVFVDGTEHEPWMMPWTGSNHSVQAQRGDNDLDNVEKVQIDGNSGSNIEVVISHKGSLQGGSQKFALVLSGVVLDTSSFVRVKSPKGGEEWEQFTTHKIRWSSNVDEPVDIILLDGSTVVDTLAKTYTNSGEYEWLIPETIPVGSNYKIKVICINTTDIFGESEDPFSIVPEELIADFPFEEPFESYQNESYDIGKWIQEPENDDIDWLVYTGITPTGQFGEDAGTGPGTGPMGDHTTGDGQYVYVEASYNYEDNKTAFLTSPKFDLRGVASPKLKYWLQMYAQDDRMGTLNVDVALEGDWTEGVKTYSGSQGKEWFTDSIDLAPFIGKRVQFRFRGAVGDSFYSDICLDDIGISVVDMPDFNTISNGNAKEGVDYSQDITISGGSQTSGVSFEFESAPSWLEVTSQNSSGCTIGGTPAEGDAGLQTVTIKLMVGDAYRTDEFTIDVSENSAPVFTSSPGLEVELGESYTYDISLEDDDSENDLSISGDNLPGWLNIQDNGDGTGVLSGSPSDNDMGDHSIVLLGDDNVVSTETRQEYTLKVKDDVGILNDGKKKAKESGLESVPSLLTASDSEVSFFLKSKQYSTYELYIYDNASNLVASNSGSFRSGSSDSNLSYCGRWDGFNSGGRSCFSGTYVVYLKAIKADGTVVWYKTAVGIEK